MERKDRAVIYGTMQVFVWRDRHKPRKILVNTVDILANTRISPSENNFHGCHLDFINTLFPVPHSSQWRGAKSGVKTGRNLICIITTVM